MAHFAAMQNPAENHETQEDNFKQYLDQPGKSIFPKEEKQNLNFNKLYLTLKGDNSKKQIQNKNNISVSYENSMMKGQRKLLASILITENKTGEYGETQLNSDKITMINERSNDKHTPVDIFGERQKAASSHMTDKEFLDLVKAKSNQGNQQQEGGLPWEIRGVFNKLQKVCFRSTQFE